VPEEAIIPPEGGSGALFLSFGFLWVSLGVPRAYRKINKEAVKIGCTMWALYALPQVTDLYAFFVSARLSFCGMGRIVDRTIGSGLGSRSS
jgi:hypothetical protein